MSELIELQKIANRREITEEFGEEVLLKLHEDFEFMTT